MSTESNKPITKYLVSRMFPGTPMHEVKVIRETASSFWTLEPDGSERKRKKDSAIRKLYDTMAEARSAIITREEARVERLTKELARAETHLANARNTPMSP